MGKFVVCEGSVNAIVELGNCFITSVTVADVWDDSVGHVHAPMLAMTK